MNELSTDSTARPLEREAIAALAYRLWQQRGCPAGSGERDWLEAEAILRAESLRPAADTPQSKATAPHPPAPITRRKPRAPKTPTAAAAPPAAGAAAAARKTRVTRTRPARPDA